MGGIQCLLPWLNAPASYGLPAIKSAKSYDEIAKPLKAQFRTAFPEMGLENLENNQSLMPIHRCNFLKFRNSVQAFRSLQILLIPYKTVDSESWENLLKSLDAECHSAHASLTVLAINRLIEYEEDMDEDEKNREAEVLDLPMD